MGKRKQRGKQKGNKQKVIFVEMDELEMGEMGGNGGKGSMGEKNISGQVCPVVIGHESHASAKSLKLFLCTLSFCG